VNAFVIRQCELPGRPGTVDVRLSNGVIANIGQGLETASDHTVIDARGGALLPGLHDHHIHLVSLAASFDSLRCGPADMDGREAFAAALRAANDGDGWLRAIGYHPSLAGDIDRHWLDRHIPDRPVRVQHRGGRLWLVNTAGLRALGILDAGTDPSLPPGIEQRDGLWTGRLYECDDWLRTKIPSQLPALDAVSRQLARCGVSGVTDTTPHNGQVQWQHFANEQESGRLMQDARVMGGHDLPSETELSATTAPALSAGEFKVHLLESQLPDTAALCLDIRRAHARGRAVAIHCVTSAELAFALGCLDTAGVLPGDRIEHASVTPGGLLSTIRSLGLRVVAQPHFLAERGDQYLRDVAAAEQPWLYRLRAFLDKDIPLAGGSDAPFGSADPWRAMAAAVSRRTAGGVVMRPEESLTPEQALALYTSAPAAPGLGQRRVAVGAAASLCLLSAPWREARENLCSDLVAHTWNRGRLIY
jgi:predicted amidohydrolase YtcJ